MFQNVRFAVSADAQPRPLDRVLREQFPGASWNEARALIRSGKIVVNDERILDPRTLVPPGGVVEVQMTARRRDRGAVLERTAIVHLDGQVVVVDKPAGISTVPYEPHERGSLAELVERSLQARHGAKRGSVQVVHRLDKETSGLLVFARTLAAKRHLKQQLRVHSMLRRYRALVTGRMGSRTIESRLVADRGDGRRGSTDNPKLGKQAITHVVALEVLRGATLVECRLETGRTHQIRIHLSEAGHPLVGERVYTRSPTTPSAPRLMLHAAELGFIHPSTGKPLEFRVEPPADFLAVLASLRHST